MDFSDKIANLDETTSKSANIEFKGYRSGVSLTIPDEGLFADYLQELRGKLKNTHNFFEGAKISVQLGQRELSENEYNELLELFRENGLLLKNVNDRLTPLKTKNAHGSETTEKRRKPRQLMNDENIIPSITVKKTLRSGQRIDFEGNVLVLGDVNPGAEIVASGDIIVMGKLRGTVHAGAAGDATAKVFAFQITPLQIRIAKEIARGSDKKTKVRRNKENYPEIAFIKDGQIVVDKFIV